MAKREEYIQSIQLRKKGFSYSQIKNKVNVSKSTLSRWLKNLPLSNNQTLSLDVTQRRVETFRRTMKEKSDQRLLETYITAKNSLIPLTKRELYIAGLFLYWGEGSKNIKGQISLNNTNPQMMKFYIFWLTEICKVPMNKLKVSLHLYKDMSVKNEIEYWSKILNMPLDQFIKPYIKDSLISQIQHKGFVHGTCGILFGDILLKEKIMKSIEVISDSYSKTR